MEKLTLGKKIRLIREMKGLKQENVANSLKMTQNGYGKIERDETDVPYSRLNSIADTFGVSVSDLVNLEEQKIIYAINKHKTYSFFIFIFLYFHIIFYVFFVLLLCNGYTKIA